MIRRLFYMSLGAFLAVWTMRKLQSLRPDHVARRTADHAVTLADRFRDFAGEVWRLSASRETELRAEFGLGTVDETNGKNTIYDVKDGR
ncbi:hypothetical protein GCM10010116_42910 [Microbispora rosea subsp. aerata]|nr:hypothetical protein [Microbispora rosea]GGO21338.1 hypothetical protein GCM10010116_42910 [Microbispora rosea subsp. aerata]GIH57337.1 hypothetical protein Mro02_42510 [Microbispora rosea subsp. aerata]GLJ84207.1 hypothetical protein GCM10017588_29350 [Microbispora rosea subsp. aerata]